MALEALQGFEAVVVVVEIFSTRVFNDFQLFLVKHVFGQTFYMYFSQDCCWFCLDGGLFFPRLPHSQEISPCGWPYRQEGGNSRVWDWGRVIVPIFRWVQPWSISRTQAKAKYRHPCCWCYIPSYAEGCRNAVVLDQNCWTVLICFLPAVAARHFERSTIRSRSFKKINKAFSVLRRTKSGSAVSNQTDRERETVGNSAAGEEGNVLFILCYHLKWGRGPYPRGNWISMTDMPFMWWAVCD